MRKQIKSNADCNDEEWMKLSCTKWILDRVHSQVKNDGTYSSVIIMVG